MFAHFKNVRFDIISPNFKQSVLIIALYIVLLIVYLGF